MLVGNRGNRNVTSVTGHRCESSLQAYWAPSVQERREWRDILSSRNVPTRSGQGPQTLNLRPSNATMMDMPVSLSNFTINGTAAADRAAGSVARAGYLGNASQREILNSPLSRFL